MGDQSQTTETDKMKKPPTTLNRADPSGHTARAAARMVETPLGCEDLVLSDTKARTKARVRSFH